MHDARRGFYDIKPLIFDSDGSSWLPQLLWVAFFCVVLGLVLYYLLPRIKREPQSVSPPDPPYSLLLKNLLELKNLQLPDAALASEVSLAFRQYLETIFDLPATDLTRHELSQRLETALAKRLPILPAIKRGEFMVKIDGILSNCDVVAFDTRSKALNSSAVEQIVSDIRILARELEHRIQSELLRVQSVSDIDSGTGQRASNNASI